MSKIKLKFSILIVFLVLFYIVLPQETQADYVWQGKHFSTYTELKTYAEKYMEAWRIAHGIENGTHNTTTSTTQNTDERYFDINTSLVKDISKNSARFYGKINFSKSNLVRIWFDFGTSPTKLIMRTDTEVLQSSKNETSFDRKVLHLNDNTKYYYRAGGIDENGNIQYGSIRSFSTMIDATGRTSLIGIVTGNAKDINENRATLRATITFKKESFAYVWFLYGEEPNDLYMKTSENIALKTNGRYSSKTITRLDSNTIYYYRVVAQDRNGNLAYGKIKSLKTKIDKVDEKPKVTTKNVTNITRHSATIAGEVDMNDFRDGVVFFIYGEDRSEIDQVKTRYTTYNEIRERGDRRQKVLLDNNFDRYKSFTTQINYLDLHTKYYYAIGVAYEDINGDDVILMGYTRYFSTKN